MTAIADGSRDPWTGSVRRWIGLAGARNFMAALTSLLSLVGLSLLYRELEAQDEGTLAILLSLSDIFSLFALLVAGTVITRLYAPAHACRFREDQGSRA